MSLSLFTPIENLVPKTHPYRKFIQLLNFDVLLKPLSDLDNTEVGRHGYGINKSFRMLLLQFLEDLSDRQLERFLQENIAGKWFCGFSLDEITPDFSCFSKFRKRIGTSRLGDLFNRVNDSLKQQGCLKEVFTFVDSSMLISKLTTWSERDKAIESGEAKLNNQNIDRFAKDKQARMGCKGKDKYWYGYKRHLSVDTQSGLINKAAVTPANVTDAKGLKHICPRSGAVLGDKGYCTKPAQSTLIKNNCHDMTIKTKNMKIKNKDKDRWISGCRSPYERVFSKTSNRARYGGIAKNQFQIFMQAFAHNLKRLVVLEVKDIQLIPV